MLGETIDFAVARACAEFVGLMPLADIEPIHLIEALLRGWYRVRYADFMERYEILHVEKEMPVNLTSDLVLATRSDVIVRERSTKRIYVINWKTFGNASDKKDWNGKWLRDIQMKTEALAAEGFLGEPVSGTIVEGLYKGTKKDGQLRSGLIYAYKTMLPSGTVVYQPEYTNRKGWTRFPVWEEEFPNGKGVTAWVEWLPLEELETYFVTSAPILKNRSVVDDWIKQVVTRETDAEHLLSSTSEEDRLIFFEQNWGSHCNYCPFIDVCEKATSIGDLMEQGELVPRIDHHVSR